MGENLGSDWVRGICRLDSLGLKTVKIALWVSWRSWKNKRSEYYWAEFITRSSPAFCVLLALKRAGRHPTKCPEVCFSCRQNISSPSHGALLPPVPHGHGVSLPSRGVSGQSYAGGLGVGQEGATQPPENKEGKVPFWRREFWRPELKHQWGRTPTWLMPSCSSAIHILTFGMHHGFQVPSVSGMSTLQHHCRQSCPHFAVSYLQLQPPNFSLSAPSFPLHPSNLPQVNVSKYKTRRPHCGITSSHLECQYPLWTLVCIPVAPLLIHFLVDPLPC